MLRGWLQGGLIKHAIVVDHAVQELKLQFADQAHLLDFYLNVSDLPEDADADLVVLAIKPQRMAEMLSDLAPRMKAGWMVMTVAAGLRISFYQQHLRGHEIIRIMPNTPAMQGKGMTVGILPPHMKPDVKARIEQLIRTTGDFFWLDGEEQMDAAMAVSASGPAYYFYMTEALAAAGAANGLSPEQAMRLARQTLVGAGEMAEKRTKVSMAQMREDVTSPGGVTEATLRVWKENSAFETLIADGIAANIKRARELAGD